MIKRVLFLVVLCVSAALSATFNFEEQRYSDALGKTMNLNGKISFEKDRLSIKYENSDQEIIYEDLFIKLKKNGQKAELADEQMQKMSEYFKIILMLYENDSKKLQERFEITKKETQTLLYPKDYIKEFIEKVTLQKDNGKLDEIKLFFKNSDTITIDINDEIR